MTKRIIETTIALIAIVILTPIIIVVALLIRLKIGAPVIFKQQRPGLHEKPFNLYKFRTMSSCKDKNGELLSDEERLQSFGEKLRMLGLDELPQLINVLKGDLSIVGPRPLLMEYLPLYTEQHAKRHTVKPGMTGWAQINGRNTINWEDKFELDIWYVNNQSLWLDIKIIFLTFYKIMGSDGIVKQGKVPMQKYKGSRSNEENNYHR